MKYLSILIFILFFFSDSLEGQLALFKLKDFNTPDYKYRSFYIDLSGNVLSQKNDATTTITGNGKYNRLKLKNTLSYYNTALSAKRHTQTGISFHSDYDYIKNFSTGKTNEYKGWVSVNHSNINYIRPKKFLAFNLNYSSSFNYEKQKYINSTTKTTYILSYLQTPLYLGQGVIQDVTDAWRAKRILKQLTKLGMIERNHLDSDQIKNFASEIYDLKRTRYFDSRLALIRDINYLDKWLQNQKIIKTSNVLYVANLMDMYKYGIQTRRLNGNRIMFGVSPYLRLYTDLQIRTRSNSYSSGYLFIAYDRFQPINDQLQFDLRTNISIGYGDFYNKSSINTLAEGRFTGNSIVLALGYFPTSRTSFNISLKSSIFYNEVKHFREKSTFAFSYNLNLDQTIQYYLSPRTSIDFYFRTYVTYGENINHQFLIRGFSIPYYNTTSYSTPIKGKILKFYASFSIKHYLF